MAIPLSLRVALHYRDYICHGTYVTEDYNVSAVKTHPLFLLKCLSDLGCCEKVLVFCRRAEKRFDAIHRRCDTDIQLLLWAITVCEMQGKLTARDAAKWLVSQPYASAADVWHAGTVLVTPWMSFCFGRFTMPDGWVCALSSCKGIVWCLWR